MPVNSWTDTAITVTIPSGATTGNMVVTVGGVPSNGITFNVTLPAPGSPVLTAINPPFATAGTSVSVTLTGTGFTTGSTTVTATGGIAVTSVVVVNPTTVTATFTLPSAATTANVTVTTPAGTSNGLTFSVTTTVQPPPTGGTTFQLVSITGGPLSIPDGTYQGQPGISLFLTQAWSPSITLAVGASVFVQGTGSYDGYFTLAGISAGPDNFGMTLVAGANTNTNVVLQQGSVILGGTPGSGGGGGVSSITSLTPATGPVGTAVTIAGSGFGSTQGASTATFNGIAAAVTSWSDPSIVVTVPAGASTGNVVVTTANGPSNGVTFTVTTGGGGSAPTLTTVTPSSHAANTATVMTLAGTGFTGATAVNYSGTGITRNVPTVASDTSLSTTFGVSLSATSGNVTVTAPAGTSNSAGFSVTAWVPPASPLITSITPTSGNAGSAPTITINGSGFTGGSTVQYSGSGGTISNVVVVSATQITITLTLAAGAASGNITVTTASGTSNGMSFSVTGMPAAPTPAGYPAFMYGGVAIPGGSHAGQLGIYAGMQVPMPATAVAGASVTVVGTGTYDGTFVVALVASPTDLFLVAGSNSATTIISKQGLVQFP